MDQLIPAGTEQQHDLAVIPQAVQAFLQLTNDKGYSSPNLSKLDEKTMSEVLAIAYYEGASKTEERPNRLNGRITFEDIRARFPEAIKLMNSDKFQGSLENALSNSPIILQKYINILQELEDVGGISSTTTPEIILMILLEEATSADNSVSFDRKARIIESHNLFIALCKEIRCHRCPYRYNEYEAFTQIGQRLLGQRRIYGISTEDIEEMSNYKPQVTKEGDYQGRLNQIRVYLEVINGLIQERAPRSKVNAARKGIEFLIDNLRRTHPEKANDIIQNFPRQGNYLGYAQWVEYPGENPD